MNHVNKFCSTVKRMHSSIVSLSFFQNLKYVFREIAIRFSSFFIYILVGLLAGEYFVFFFFFVSAYKGGRYGIPKMGSMEMYEVFKRATIPLFILNFAFLYWCWRMTNATPDNQVTLGGAMLAFSVCLVIVFLYDADFLVPLMARTGRNPHGVDLAWFHLFHTITGFYLATITRCFYDRKGVHVELFVEVVAMWFFLEIGIMIMSIGCLFYKL
ncbi:hypothetical protein BEWA_044660 (mitochondrion) [Theileria equi strain WA]|uniref:Uncharacterized protein n=1 Tax=Theileria equi strain WA TaxID=1537102 RepID=L1L8W3_THEEQ|nr:hypothetical protein BEWA_044660 [Theileria equi strain WA]EKX71951.1 hypothetical protein BEWA_044660 [Theileria equi strain WA]|eukprot:XP_025033544.1 hypothetical protein BEWA_044660 (mitochondrion) [Theileria equi strain WA]